MRGSTQVGTCTPLVTEVMGTSEWSKPGQRAENMPRDTTPCSLATPLARWASRRPMTAMLNTNGLPSAKSSRPRSRILATGTSGRQAGFEEVLDLGDLEAVDAGRHRRVGGEDGGGAPGGQGFVPAQRLRAGHQFLDPLDAQEPGVALVGVEDLRRGDAGEPLEVAQGLDPAHAQQELLLQPVVTAAAVQPVGDAAGGFVVARNVGVQQQQRNASDVGPPDVRQQAPAVGERKRDLDGLAVAVGGGLAQQRQGQPVRVQHRVRFLLPGVAGERLLEVAGLVEETDADQRHAKVRGRFQVVAGQDAKAAGVLGKDLGDAELGGEVGDAGRGAVAQALVPARLLQVAVEVVGSGMDTPHHVLVRGQALQLFPADQSRGTSRDRGRSPPRSPGLRPSKSSRVGRCQDHRRLVASRASGRIDSGRTVRTVNLRIAFTSETLTDKSLPGNRV